MDMYLGTFYANPDLSDQVYVQYLMILSLICDGLNYLFLKNFKGLKSHPMMLYRWLSLANFFVFWTNLLTPYICRWKFDEMLQFFSFGILSDWKSLEGMILIVQF